MQRVIIVAFSGAQTLDLAGPGEVFAAAGRRLGRPVYQVVLASREGGTIESTCGFRLRTKRLASVRLRVSDTVLVGGGDERAIRDAVGDREVVDWVARAAMIVRRIGSVCSGAFVLAAGGVLDGRRAATHWSACQRLARMRPAIAVDANAIFVRDGHVWTSAGVTTGIDMALAMVEEDWDRTVADGIAAHLVLYARRPGFQSQFSDALLGQAERGDPLGGLVGRARGELRGLDVPRLAKLAGMSGRTLHRRCREQLGTTPAKLVERLRVEYAKTLLTTTAHSLKRVADESGFVTPARMRSAFERELGVGPSELRLLSGGGASG